ncbi:MAG: glucose-1-phosphate thymidylyltransferase [Candidatus Glassbacteria bacterium]|nr:glucose-1-phosphate thymidylyltransferase [Candidatus Glassbacteria bacterium]
MQVLLFEDRQVAEQRPITLSRPAFRITMGGTDLEKLVRDRGFTPGLIVRDYLAPLVELKSKNEPVADKKVLFINASMVPRVSDLEEILKLCEKNGRFCILQGERVAASYFPEIKISLADLNPENINSLLLDDNPPVVDQPVLLVNRTYEVVKYNMQIIGDNLERMAERYHRLHDGVYVGRDVELSDHISFDTHDGLIIIDDNSFVSDYVLLRGPLYIGRKVRVNEYSAIKEECSIRDTVKIGGEVEASVVESYSNKQHHGFLGHAYLGSWINIGAGTSNSDLKNTYGTVNVVHKGVKENTGMQFLGCIVGDYSKTAINTSIFTGKTIGFSSLVYGYVTGNVPSFTNWGQSLGSVTKYNLEAAVKTQKRMFGRRKIEQTPVHIQLIKDIFDMTEDEHGPYKDEPVAF